MRLMEGRFDAELDCRLLSDIPPNRDSELLHKRMDCFCNLDVRPQELCQAQEGLCVRHRCRLGENCKECPLLQRGHCGKLFNKGSWVSSAWSTVSQTQKNCSRLFLRFPSFSESKMGVHSDFRKTRNCKKIKVFTSDRFWETLLGERSTLRNWKRNQKARQRESKRPKKGENTCTSAASLRALCVRPSGTPPSHGVRLTSPGIGN